jgi:hypothetical protein
LETLFDRRALRDFSAQLPLLLATLGIAWAQHGSHYAGIQARAMIFGGIALLFYSVAVCPIGGLFLALTAIFCASATLIERHEIHRKPRSARPNRNVAA